MALNVYLAINAPTVSPITLQRLVTQALAEIDPSVPASAARPMTELVAESMANRTFMLTLLAAAAAMALVLSAVGLYGVIAYVVGQREREIGVRIAVGASGRQIGGLVIGQALRLVALGITLGTAGALAGTRVLTSFLFEISPTDPAVLGGVACLVALLGLLASGLPTLRAIRTDPVIALPRPTELRGVAGLEPMRSARTGARPGGGRFSRGQGGRLKRQADSFRIPPGEFSPRPATSAQEPVRSPASPSPRWRWGSVPTPRSFRSSTRCSSGHCRSPRPPTAWSPSRRLARIRGRSRAARSANATRCSPTRCFRTCNASRLPSPVSRRTSGSPPTSRRRGRR
ncbi:MAG: FtsX-like permease family protein [Gemmatimonadetes bacterium]|nr:FtsX-like permease family protein [Gemmatimonadota bacterium]